MIGRVRVKPFWMVYGMGQGAPTVRHDTEASAIAEASRLARRNPDVAFVVLAATHSVLKRDVEVDRIEPDLEAQLGMRLSAWDLRPGPTDDAPF